MGIIALLGPMLASGGSGIFVRVLLMIIRGSIKRKNDREGAINYRIAKSSGTYDATLDDDSRDTANHIAIVMCWLFVAITLVCLCFPQAEFTIFLPDTIEHRNIDLFLFSYSWHSDLENSVVTINAGGVVYIAINFCIFVMSAFYKGGGNKQAPKKREEIEDEDKKEDES